MKTLDIPHQMADYLCPINGICDIYQWKTGIRIPEELLFYSNVGITYITDKRSQPSELLFLNGNKSIGKRQYEFWGKYMGYTVHHSEGLTFQTVFPRLLYFIELDIPVVLFGLDMYYLDYQEKYYKQTHIPGHVVLMVGYDENSISVLDNSKDVIQYISISNLEKAWEKGYLGISKKNCYFAIEMDNPKCCIDDILQPAYHQIYQDYFHSPVKIVGEKAYSKLHERVSLWGEQTLDILNHIYTYTGSRLPETYFEKRTNFIGILNHHSAGRDEFSKALIKYVQNSHQKERWLYMANEFLKSASIIEEIATYCFEILDETQNFGQEKFLGLFNKLKEQEKKALYEMKSRPG